MYLTLFTPSFKCTPRLKLGIEGKKICLFKPILALWGFWRLGICHRSYLKPLCDFCFFLFITFSKQVPIYFISLGECCEASDNGKCTENLHQTFAVAFVWVVTDLILISGSTVPLRLCLPSRDCFILQGHRPQMFENTGFKLIWDSYFISTPTTPDEKTSCCIFLWPLYTV